MSSRHRPFIIYVLIARHSLSLSLTLYLFIYPSLRAKILAFRICWQHTGNTGGAISAVCMQKPLKQTVPFVHHASQSQYSYVAGKHFQVRLDLEAYLYFLLRCCPVSGFNYGIPSRCFSIGSGVFAVFVFFTFVFGSNGSRGGNRGVAIAIVSFGPFTTACEKSIINKTGDKPFDSGFWMRDVFLHVATACVWDAKHDCWPYFAAMLKTASDVLNNVLSVRPL